MAAAPAVLLVGAGGQVGRACLRRAPADAAITALSRGELDITDTQRVDECVDRLRPDVLINAAAYTSVDRAESEPEAANRANHDGPRNLARALARLGRGRMIQLSTDYVFSGDISRPYRPGDEARPLNVYGVSKLAGERAVRDALGDRALVLRTAWVYSAAGSNFLLTMLRLMKSGTVRVVSDQVGTPTAADSLAMAIWRAVERESSGVHHWTDAGVASRYEFAGAIAAEASRRGLLEAPVSIVAVASSEFPAAARRPARCELDKSQTIESFGLEPLHWRVRLREVIGGIGNG